MTDEKLLLIGAGAGLVIVLGMSYAANAAIDTVQDSRQSLITDIVDWFARLTGLEAEQNRLIDDPAYAEYQSTLG